MKYNYVIFGYDSDLYRFSYKDVISLENVRYLDKLFGECGRILSFIQRVHKSRIANKFLNLPLKHIWNSFYFVNDFKDNRPLCFIFTTDKATYIQEYNYYNFLKNLYPDSRFVWFLSDILESRSGKYNINLLKKYFDLIISFDPKDCEKYGFIYHPLVFSSFKERIDEISASDVYFLGQAKDRLSKIISVYEILQKKGLKCDFYITGVDKKDQIYSDEIKYNKRLSYAQNLQHAIHSKCLLEIMQKNGYGYTQRVVEILGLNKKLLTNNPIIKDAPFYNPEYISTFNAPDEIDMNFLNHIKDNKFIDYKYKEKISPKEFLYFIENHLN